MADVEMMPVKSTNVGSVGYDAEAQELRVAFQSGATYAYSGVSPSLYDDLLTANSPGGYLAKWIIGRYPTRKL